MIKRLLATMTVIGGVAMALHYVFEAKYRRGFSDAISKIIIGGEYVPVCRELEY
jgi:hypothetical protein